MANLSKTITNTLTVFGGGVTSKWGAFNWGEANWGANSVVTVFMKFIVNALVLTDSVSKSVTIKTNETLNLEGEQTGGCLASGDWFYVYPPDTDCSVENIVTSFTTLTPTGASYTQITYTTSTWS